MNSLKEVNFDAISIKDLEKVCENESLMELRERVIMVDKAVRNMEMPALATPTERLKLREDMLAKANLLRQIITTKENEQTREQQKRDAQNVENTVVEQLPNLRYSSEDAISRMQQMGTMGVPLDVPQWHKLTSTTIEIKCKSGKTRKLDLKKLNPQVLHNLLQKPFAPMFFIMEPEGMISKEGEPVKIWSDQKDYMKVVSQRQVQRTVLALMWVG
jgi:hypothetical protein